MIIKWGSVWLSLGVSCGTRGLGIMCKRMGEKGGEGPGEVVYVDSRRQRLQILIQKGADGALAAVSGCGLRVHARGVLGAVQ